ncbi:hypothetical protein MTP99_009829 [Tenebrio molitor]|nr:hypothetical protein MTP99_009829 [Tenebrio molitor]
MMTIADKPDSVNNAINNVLSGRNGRRHGQPGPPCGVAPFWVVKLGHGGGRFWIEGGRQLSVTERPFQVIRIKIMTMD